MISAVSTAETGGIALPRPRTLHGRSSRLVSPTRLHFPKRLDFWVENGVQGGKFLWGEWR